MYRIMSNSPILAVALLILGFTGDVWAVGTPAGTRIESRATGNYSDSNGNLRGNVESNSVTFIVSKKAGVDVTATIYSNSVTAGDTAWHDLTVSNVGNDTDTLIVTFGFETENTAMMPEDDLFLYFGGQEYKGVPALSALPQSSDILTYQFTRWGSITETLTPPESDNNQLPVLPDELGMDEVKLLKLGIKPDRSSVRGRRLRARVYVSSYTEFKSLAPGDSLFAHDVGSVPGVDYFETSVSAELEPDFVLNQFNSVQVTNSNPMPGDTIVYRIEVRNLGSGPAFDAVLVVDAANGVTYLPDSIRARFITPESANTYYVPSSDRLLGYEDPNQFLTPGTDELESGSAIDSIYYESGPFLDTGQYSIDADSSVIVYLNDLPPRSSADETLAHGVILYYKVVVGAYTRAGTELDNRPTIDASNSEDTPYAQKSFSMEKIPVGILQDVRLRPIKAYESFEDSSSNYILPDEVFVDDWITDNSLNGPTTEGGILGLTGDPGDTLYYEFMLTNHSNIGGPSQVLRIDLGAEKEEGQFPDAIDGERFFDYISFHPKSNPMLSLGDDQSLAFIETMDIQDSLIVIVRMEIPTTQDDQDFVRMTIRADASSSFPTDLLKKTREQKERYEIVTVVTAPFIVLTKWIMAKADFENEIAFYEAHSSDTTLDEDFSDFNVAEAVPGDTLVYVVRIYNEGEGSATDVRIVDEFGGDNMKFVPGSAVVQGVLFPDMGRRPDETADEVEVYDRDHIEYESVVDGNDSDLTATIPEIVGYYEWQVHCYVVLN